MKTLRSFKSRLLQRYQKVSISGNGLTGLPSKIIFLDLTNTFVVGTQRNRLTESIILSTHSIGFRGQISILEHEKRPLCKYLFRKFGYFISTSSNAFCQIIFKSCNTFDKSVIDDFGIIYEQKWKIGKTYLLQMCQNVSSSEKVIITLTLK